MEIETKREHLVLVGDDRDFSAFISRERRTDAPNETKPGSIYPGGIISGDWF